MAKNMHNAVSYRIWIGPDETFTTKSWDKAVVYAVGMSMCEADGADIKIECMVKTRKGAEWLYSDNGGEKWDAQRAIPGDLGADVVPFECFFIAATHHEGDVT
jgi:hypothetical protein